MGDAVAPCARAHVLSTGTLTTEGVPFAVWVRMARTIHALCVCEFHSACCCTQCYRGHMSCNGVVVVAAALSARGVLCSGIRLDARGVVQPKHPRRPRVPPLSRNHAVAHCVGHGRPCPRQVHGVGRGGYLLKAALRLGICHLDHQSLGVAVGCLTACCLLPTGVPIGPPAPPGWLVLAWCCRWPMWRPFDGAPCRRAPPK